MKQYEGELLKDKKKEGEIIKDEKEGKLLGDVLPEGDPLWKTKKRLNEKEEGKKMLNECAYKIQNLCYYRRK